MKRGPIEASANSVLMIDPCDAIRTRSRGSLNRIIPRIAMPDAGPNRVGDAHVNSPRGRLAEQPKAQQHDHKRSDNRRGIGLETIGVLEPQRPNHLANVGENEKDPSHFCLTTELIEEVSRRCPPGPSRRCRL